MKIPVYIYAQIQPYSKEVNYFAYFVPDSKHMGVEIAKTEIDFDEPPLDKVIQGAVVNMRAEQQKIRAEAEVKYQNIEQQIQEMLCIEDKSQDIVSDEKE